MFFGCWKEPSHWDGSFDYQNIFRLRNKKNNFQFCTHIWELSFHSLWDFLLHRLRMKYGLFSLRPINNLSVILGQVFLGGTSPKECRTKHPGTKHPMPFFATPDKTSRINLPPLTKHPMQFLSPRTKHPMPFSPPRTKHPMLLLPPRTKHPTLCLKPMKVHKTSHLVNCHYYYWYS